MRRQILVLAVAAALAGNAVAQDTAAQTAPEPPAPALTGGEDPSADNLDTVVVVGYRKSLRKSLDAKQVAPVVTEQLSAEEIGKLPDVTIAESLARLPGLASDRNVAGATRISIRGMGDVLSSGTLNGREVATASPGRSVEYSQYPSELITGAAVYKSPMASMVEGGVAGSIDLRTVSPLDYDKRVVSGNLRGRRNQYSGDLPGAQAYGGRTGLAYVDQSADRHWGVALGYAGQYNPFNSLETSLYTYRDVEYAGSIAGAPPGRDPNDTLTLPFGADYGYTAGDDRRHGGIGVLQWKPSEQFEAKLDVLASRFQARAVQRGMRLEGFGSFGESYGSDAVFRDFAFRSGTVRCITQETDGTPCSRGYGLDLRAVNEDYDESTRLLTSGLNLKWTFERWRFGADLGHSRADFATYFATLSSKPFALVDGVLQEVTPQATLGYSRAGALLLTTPNDFADPAGNYLTRFRVQNDNRARDEVRSLRLDAERYLDGGLLTSLQAGVRWNQRSKRMDKSGVDIDIDPQAIPARYVLGRFEQGRADGAFGSSPVIMLDVPGIRRDVFGDTVSLPNAVASWDVDERVAAAYLQANFDTQLGTVPLSGNVGVRAVGSRSQARGTRAVEGVLSPVAIPNRYTDTLPSLNVAAQLQDDLQLRLAAAKTLARPAIDALNPGFDRYGDTAFDGGNPLLEPFRATQLDLSLEKYFSRDAMVAFALFYKDLDTFVTLQSNLVTTPGAGSFVAMQPVNGKGGYIRGLELSWQQSFSGLPGWLAGSGVYANYSLTESNVAVSEAFNSGRYGLDGLSRHVGTVSLFYARGPVDTRLSYSYRSAFTRPQASTQAFVTNAAQGWLDYQFTWRARNGLDYFFQVDNVLNQARDGYYADPQRRAQYRKFGRNYLVGLNFTF